MDTLSLSPLNFASQIFLDLECRNVVFFLSEIYSALIHTGGRGGGEKPTTKNCGNITRLP